MSIVSMIIDYEAGELDGEEKRELFQSLVDTGLAWRLQGFYGREAERMIEDGEIHIPTGRERS